jgi:hypothetical protein
MTTPLHKVLKNMESFDLICLTRNSFNSIVSCQVQKKIYNIIIIYFFIYIYNNFHNDIIE